mmetsp:Transcript_20955/g.66121  ORF Transcript_20955/g.66121 Transcript_20955/m.66121 type:complete len:216 (-) Transcript_20955:105-752(-)
MRPLASAANDAVIDSETVIRVLQHLRREVKIAEPPGEIPVAEPPVAPVSHPLHFQVVLTRPTTQEKFGITYRVVSDGAESSRLAVQTVKPTGICARHNWEMRHFPHETSLHHQQVMLNDEILVVNGKRDPNDMKTELMNALVVHLHVKRLPSCERANALVSAGPVAVGGAGVPAGAGLGIVAGEYASQGFVGQAQVQPPPQQGYPHSQHAPPPPQ